MRLPRFRIRTLMIAVAVVGVVLALIASSLKPEDDGPARICYKLFWIEPPDSEDPDPEDPNFGKVPAPIDDFPSGLPSPK